jgi:hypothetical protein
MFDRLCCNGGATGQCHGDRAAVTSSPAITIVVTYP